MRTLSYSLFSEICLYDRELSLACAFQLSLSLFFFFNLQPVDLIFRHHRVVAKVGSHLGPAAGAEARRRRAVGSGHRAESHAGDVEKERVQDGDRCSRFGRKL